MTLAIRQHVVPGSRTSENSSKWEAVAEIDGVTYRATSRRGAPQELARSLVEAGIADQPVEVFTPPLRGHIGYRSLHAMARTTFTEGKTTSLQRVRYIPPRKSPPGSQRSPKTRVNWCPTMFGRVRPFRASTGRSGVSR
jgi:hypothetical protein